MHGKQCVPLQSRLEPAICIYNPNELSRGGVEIEIEIEQSRWQSRRPL